NREGPRRPPALPGPSAIGGQLWRGDDGEEGDVALSLKRGGDRGQRENDVERVGAPAEHPQHYQADRLDLEQPQPGEVEVRRLPFGDAAGQGGIDEGLGDVAVEVW